MRTWLAVIAAVLVLAAAVGGAYWWLEEYLGEQDAVGDRPDTALAAYLDAWAGGDHARMAELVRDPPDTFEPAHDQLRTGLQVRRLEAEPAALEEDVDGRATATIMVTAEVPTLGAVEWAAELRLLRERGVWGIAWEPHSLHPDWRPGLRFDLLTTPVGRAPILAADGTELAGEGQRVTFGFEPSTVTDPEALVDAFEAAVPGSGRTVERHLRGRLVDGWFYPVVSVTREQADDDVIPVLRGVDGVLRRSDDAARSLLRDDFAVHVVGRVGDITAEQLEQLGEPYQVGDVVGQFGLERVFERDLVGSDEVAAVLREGGDGPVRVTLATGQEDPSGPVSTTLDVTVQTAIENALIGGSGSIAIVVVDGRSGAILGSASRPTDGFNRAFEGRYAPGAILSLVTMEAALADGATLDDEVECPGEAIVGGVRIVTTTGPPIGSASLRDAFAASCDTTFARIGAGLGGEAMTAAAERFGFDVAPATPLPAFGGSFPPPRDTAEAGASAAGAARVEVSPLQVAALAAAAVTGTWHVPFLLVDDEASAGARTLSAGVAEDLEALLAAAIREGPAAAAHAPGAPLVRGIAGTGHAVGEGSHAWFAGAYGDWGFAVLVEGGGRGGEVATPLAARFVQELRDLEADDGDEDG